METKKQAPVAVKVDGVEYTRIPVVGTLVFMTNPTKGKFVNPPEISRPELDLFCPDGTAFAFHIRGDELEPLVRDGGDLVFTQARPAEENDFVLVQTKSGLNHFGRLASQDVGKVVLRTVKDTELDTIPTEDISLMTPLILVAKSRKFGS